MRKVIGCVLLVLVIAAGITGCKKIINSIFPGVDADVPAITVNVPIINFSPYPVPANEIPVGTFTEAFNLDSIVRAKTGGSYGAGDVGTVQIKQINFSLANSDDQNNLSNFKSVRFTFTSNSRTDTANIGTINFPDSTMSAYTFIPTNSPDIRPYLNGSQITSNVYGQLRRYTNKALTMTVNITMKIK
jgi:hypothetical protein